MPAEPREEQVKVAIVERLEALKTAPIWHPPRLVTRSLLAPDDYTADQFPVVGLFRGFSSEIVLVEHPDVYEHRCLLNIGWYVLGTAAASADSQLGRLAQDLRDWLMADFDQWTAQLGFEVRQLWPQGERVTDGGELEPYGLAVQPWLAVFEEPTPTTA